MRKKVIYILADVAFVAIIAVIIIAGRFLKNTTNTETTTYNFRILENNEEVSALYSSGNRVYVGTNSGIHIYDAKSFEMVQSIDNISLIYTAGIVGDGCGIWVGHEEGLTYIGDDFEQIEFKYPDIPKGRVNAVNICDNNVYCGTYSGAAVLSNIDGKWKITDILTKDDGFLSDSFNVILKVDGGILFGSYLDTSGGLSFVRDDGTIECLGKDEGLPHSYITSAISFLEGRILIGTGYMRDGGLVELQKDGASYEIVRTLGTEDGLPGEKIRYLYADETSLWITTEYDGVLIIPLDKSEEWNCAEGIYLTKENGLSDNEIKCITKVNNNYWLGGKYGLTIIPDNIIK